MAMKYFLAVLALMPLVQGQTQRSISSQLRDGIEAFRDRMPCGFPEYGLPPMAPYKTEHEEIAIDTDVLQAYGEINDFRLYGLNDFDIVVLRVQALLSRVTFKFNWKNINFKTDYNVTSAQAGIGLRRHGPGKFSLKDLTVWGVVKYNYKIFSGKLSVKELSVYASLGSAKSEIQGLSKINIVNRKLNRIIEEWVMMAVNENTENLALYTNSIVMPLVNDFLSDKTLSELLAAVGSGGEETDEKEPCIPPEEED